MSPGVAEAFDFLRDETLPALFNNKIHKGMSFKKQQEIDYAALPPYNKFIEQKIKKGESISEAIISALKIINQGMIYPFFAILIKAIREKNDNFYEIQDPIFQYVLKYSMRDIRVDESMISSGEYDWIKLIIEKGVNAPYKEFDSLLCGAVENNLFKMTQFLLKAGANVNAVNNSFNCITPLSFAVRENSIEIAKLLLDHGADVNIQDSVGETSLHYAAENSFVEMTQLLLKAGANLNIQNNQGRTPLYCGFSSNFMNIIELLGSESQGDIQIDDDNFYSIPKSDDTYMRFIEIVKLLIVYGADVNIHDKQNITPLKNLVTLDDIMMQFIEKFKDKAAGESKKSQRIKILLDYAKQTDNCFIEIAKLLLDAGADATALKDSKSEVLRELLQIEEDQPSRKKPRIN